MCIYIYNYTCVYICVCVTSARLCVVYIVREVVSFCGAWSSNVCGA